MLEKIIVRLANSRLALPFKALVRRLRETYYNAEVLRRPLTKTAGLRVRVESSEPVRINLLIPEINFAHFYGGYIAKFNLAKTLTDKGYRVRIITIDQCIYDPDTWRREIHQYPRISNIFDEVEVLCCFDRSVEVPVNPNDTVVATTWWSAFVAKEFVKHLSGDRFIYMIQEFEPFTFPMGSYYALARESYGFPHYAFYSTKLLQDYFVENRIGFNHETTDDRASYSHFENAIIAFDRSELKIKRRETKRLLFYARPEAHATRNMFEIAFLALSRAIERGVFETRAWEFHGIGSEHGDIPLTANVELKMLGKFDLRSYRERLLDYDIGLALMYTPHPSLLPLEMAAAGMIVVTTSCLNKTDAELRAISPNIVAADPTIDGVESGLVEAVRRSSEYDQRAAGAEVNWSTSWEETFGSSRLETIESWIRDGTTMPQSSVARETQDH